MTTTLIENGAVLTVDDAGTLLDPGWVLIDGERIAETGSGEAPATHRRGVDQTVDAAGMAVMPGMVNAHTHLFQTFFRGLADDKPLLQWLEECIWPAAVHLDEESAHLAALAGLVENLRTGATSVIDHQYIHVDESIDDAVCRAADEVGIRFLLARGWADRNYHPPLMEAATTVLDRTQRVHERWDGAGHGRLRVELAPLIPWGCSDQAMRETVAAARSWGRGTHLHCAETAIEVEMSVDERGVRHVPWLESLGALGADVQLAHSVWLDDSELDLIASYDAVVVHCPVSNMYLASGVARVPEMLQRGITVALASDGPGSNNRQDMFETMKAAVLVQKLHHLDPVLLQPEDALRMACRGGARAFGLPDELGSVEPGRLADLVAVDLRSVFVAPVHRVPSALVYCATPNQVDTVMVGGRILIRHRELVGMDEVALLSRAEAAATEVFRRAGVASRLTR